MSDSFLQRRLIQPLLLLLKQGVTPEKLALSVALGVVLGIFPLLGSTTVLCAIAAVILKLNLPAIQIVNYFVYPLQIALLLPFFRLGEIVFRAPYLAISVTQIREMARESLWATIQMLWATTWHAVVVWSMLAPIVAAIAYLVLTPLLRYRLRRQSG